MTFTSEEDLKIADEYTNSGYIIRPNADKDAFRWIQKNTSTVAASVLNLAVPSDPEAFLNQIHDFVDSSALNDFRLKVIQGLNSLSEFRPMYFRLAKPYLEAIVGNELAMQQRINLSIQMPNDASSLLPVHADTWSGDSAFEVVVWLPLVDCFGTKAMYLLPPKESEKFATQFIQRAGSSSETIFDSIKSEVIWLEVKSGQVMLFDQSLPHGNRVNEESETRWSMNCRFKGVFTPYGDKKLGEFFEPITLRPA
ncbi:MAG: sporadic carbohydrate cluster 2OG-Fe(II) oxygenase, partial [Acidimicrobiaceae bacterium]